MRVWETYSRRLGGTALRVSVFAAAFGVATPTLAQDLVPQSVFADQFWTGFLGVLFLTALVYAIRLNVRINDLEAVNAGMAADALRDRLTGLENRYHLAEHLKRLFADEDGLLGVCHVDLEQLKNISRTLGHKAGEEALGSVTRILRDAVRDGDFIARIGGDEFVIVVSGMKTARELEVVARRVVESLDSPIMIGVNARKVGASVGVALRDDKATTPERLLMNADLALHQARTAGDGRYCLFTEAARTALEDREQVLADIREALREDAFEPFFQPQIDAETGRLIGFEALARWRHPVRGVLAPGLFLPIAEESCLIDQIGAIVIRKSLQTMARWRLAGYDAPQLGLNFSARELRDAGFVDKLQWDLELVDLAPERVCIEILESVLIERDDDPAVRNVAALSEAGFRVDLDDFGTGHASLSNFKKFKVDRLKIDRSFVENIDADQNQQKLMGAIINIASTLGVETIAEGVETEGEMRTLINMGCSNQQGYFHGFPMSADDAMGWMAENEAKRQSVALAADAPRRSA